jgi:hypothetical protein
MPELLSAEEVVGGSAEGELLWADIGVSFWGGKREYTKHATVALY